jgi:NADH-quinone oxidoreductase subunit A
METPGDSLLPAVLTVVIAAGVAASMLVLSWLLGRPKRSRVDTTPYECGIADIQPVERRRFSVKFYLVAMLFILFDIEVAFLYPWAVTFGDFADDMVFVLVEMAIFLGILVAGFLYLWWRGALDWE